MEDKFINIAMSDIASINPRVFNNDKSSIIKKFEVFERDNALYTIKNDYPNLMPSGLISFLSIVLCFDFGVEAYIAEDRVDRYEKTISTIEKNINSLPQSDYYKAVRDDLNNLKKEEEDRASRKITIAYILGGISIATAIYALIPEEVEVYFAPIDPNVGIKYKF